jgi:hypothetical protein
MPAIATFDRADLARRRRRARELTEPRGSSRNTLTFFDELIVQTRSTSKFLQVAREYRELSSCLFAYTMLADDWNSYGAEKPSTASIEATARFLKRLIAELFMPNRLVPSAEGGVAVYFNRGTKNSYIEYRNSGDVILAMYDNNSDPQVIELTKSDADEQRALSLIRTYIS